MRWGILAFIAVCLLAQPALARTRIGLDAQPAPIIDARINGHDVRLEVDLRLPDVLVLNPAAAERLGVRRVPFVNVGVRVDETASVRGRLARPRVVFANAAASPFTGIFPVPASATADGLIGPGVLPYDIITIRLGPDRGEEREIAFTLNEADDWVGETRVGGETLRVRFDVARPNSVFNRSAARIFDASGAIVSAGDLVDAHVLLGLTTRMQPVTTALTVEGLGLGTTLARTRAPLLGADEPDAIVVSVEGDAEPAGLSLGREALASCSSITVTRATRRLVLRCAN